MMILFVNLKRERKSDSANNSTTNHLQIKCSDHRGSFTNSRSSKAWRTTYLFIYIYIYTHTHTQQQGISGLPQIRTQVQLYNFKPATHLSLFLSLSQSSLLQQEWRVGVNTEKGCGQRRRIEFYWIT